MESYSVWICVWLLSLNIVLRGSFKFYLFIYLWLCWVFVAAHGLFLVAASGGYSSLWCAGFSLRWLLLLQSTGSRRAGFSSCGSWALERRLSSCGARARLLRDMLATREAHRSVLKVHPYSHLY